jgi:hypothetical protein
MGLQVIFMRHCEKERGSVHLSAAGRDRARLLPSYLLQPAGDFGRISHCFVMTMPPHKSVRCVESLAPTLAAASDTHMPCDPVRRSRQRHLVRELHAMAAAARQRGEDRTVLVCWEHSRIVDMVDELLLRARADADASSVASWGLDPEAPRDAKDCFDATWVLDFLDASRMRLTVYRQFSVCHHEAHYDHARTRVWYEKLFSCPPEGWAGQTLTKAT